MKKFLSIVLTLVLLSTVTATPVLATETTSEVVMFEDGSYLTIETTEVTASGARASTISKSGSRELAYYNGNEELQWDYTLYGTFLYREGISAQAQNRRDSYNIYNSEWSLKSHDTSMGWDIVYGTVTMKLTVLFVTIKTVTANSSISCDAYGNLTYGDLTDPD